MGASPRGAPRGARKKPEPRNTAPPLASQPFHRICTVAESIILHMIATRAIRARMFLRGGKP